MSQKPHILHVVGARPNFMKVAPVMRALDRAGVGQQTLVHTGQHYDANMSDFFFRDLALPTPDVFLGVGSGSHAEQTAKIMVAFERLCLERRPDLVMVVGDVNSTLACSLVASKLPVACAHVEAGLRSGNRHMPEEVNRVVTDHLSELLFTPSPDADKNLALEGVPAKRIVRVGNVMIDSLLWHLKESQARPLLSQLELKTQNYAAITLHRAENVDNIERLTCLVGILQDSAKRLPLVFAIHPRTRKRLADAGLLARLEANANIKLVDPLGYLDFVCLVSQAQCVLTDSGGLQEETTALGVPCLTLRDETERPITISEGTNQLVGLDRARVQATLDDVMGGKVKKGIRPDLWDGRAAERIATAIDGWWHASRPS